MIIVKIYIKNEIPVRLEVKGHANWDKKGNDIVCSSFSFLIQSISMYMLNNGLVVEERENNKIKIDLVRIRKYNFEIYKYLIFSIKILEKKYIKHINIIEIKE